MSILVHYLFAIFFGLGFLEIVLTMPLSIIYTSVFLYFEKRNFARTGIKHPVSSWVVFLSTLILTRLSIGVGTDATDPDYILPGLLNINTPSYYPSFLLCILLALLLFNILYFVFSYKWSKDKVLVFSIVVSVLLFVTHLFPFAQSLKLRSDITKFINELPVVNAEQVKVGPTMKPLSSIEKTPTDRIYSDTRIRFVTLYFDKKGGELFQYPYYSLGRRSKSVLYTSGVGNTMRIKLPYEDDKWFPMGAAEDEDNLYLYVQYYVSIQTFKEDPSQFVIYKIPGVIK